MDNTKDDRKSWRSGVIHTCGSDQLYVTSETTGNNRVAHLFYCRGCKAKGYWYQLAKEMGKVKEVGQRISYKKNNSRKRF